MLARRPLLAGLAIAVLGPWAKGGTMEESALFGLIGKIRAKPGTRAQLIDVLLLGAASMEGCLGYTVGEDLAEADAIWVTETWESRAAHAASLELPEVRQAIARGRPMIAGFDLHVETRPVMGELVMTSDSPPAKED
ncbi:MAG: putative quinol monooxygenase [Sphingomonas sp.]